jgi:hypothetical protein
MPPAGASWNFMAQLDEGVFFANLLAQYERGAQRESTELADFRHKVETASSAIASFKQHIAAEEGKDAAKTPAPAAVTQAAAPVGVSGLRTAGTAAVQHCEEAASSPSEEQQVADLQAIANLATQKADNDGNSAMQVQD